MKRNIKMAGIILIVLMAATGCNYVHRGIRGMIYHSRERRHERAMEFNHAGRMSYGNMHFDGPYRFHGPQHHMYGNKWQRQGPGNRGDWEMGPGYRMRGEMRMHQGARNGRGMGPMAFGPSGHNNRGIERIPNLTDNQRKEIAGLRQKQMEEMDKVREESFAKMQTIREENRSKIMNLLTDDQKKFLESNRPAYRQRLPQDKK